ncbi:MAG: T9SS type A sorting domain-containing protein, partial [Bacteroidales bacterium]|nr:T9SS type A sorting domain-containing protein [Bacteroidales bacterium]
NLNDFTGHYQNVFNTEDFSDGVYILNIRCEKAVINKKIIINH